MTARLRQRPLRVYRSADSHDHELDHARGHRPGERTLGIGQQQGIDPGDRAFDRGEYYYGACVDAVTNESDTNGQLLGVGEGGRVGTIAANPTEPVGEFAFGRQQQPNNRGALSLCRRR